MATIVVGDVHGCLDELEALLRACGRGAGDELVLVGDLVAKGPDSHGVLCLLRELGARSVLGNHDARALRVRAALARGPGAGVGAIGPELEALMASLDDQDFALLSGLPLFLRLPKHDAIVVHAGLLPGVPLEQQDPDLLLNMRTIRPDGRGSKRPDDGVLWGSRWPGPELVLFGHHATRGLQQHPFALGLDTGCVYGKRLTACILPERKLVSVPARRAYAPVGRAA